MTFRKMITFFEDFHQFPGKHWSKMKINDFYSLFTIFITKFQCFLEFSGPVNLELVSKLAGGVGILVDFHKLAC